MSALILASTSVYRKALLERLGLSVECIAPGVDEEAVQARVTEPVELAVTLARAKARAVTERYPGRIVVGGDQLVAFRGRILGKPGTPEKAVEQLMAFSGETHELVTAMTIIAADGSAHDHTNISRLTMRPLSRERIASYVALDSPLDCAGSYKIESAGISLFSRIETDDHTAITGLPLLALVDILERLGVNLP